MSKKSDHWMVKLPGEVYANDLHFTQPVGIEVAQQTIRDRLKVKRLPRGTEFWTYTQSDEAFQRERERRKMDSRDYDRERFGD